MKKILFLLTVLSFSLLALGATEYVVSTEHFDFIYSEETERSASEIIAVAEDYYSDLVSFFSTDPDLHIPVYFTSREKSYNAYYSFYTSSHIVMYVTDNPLSLLSNAEKPFALTFYHELTHAFTSSIKSSVVAFFSSIFGDAFTPSNLILNQALTEGIAVYTESRYGEGRLNSPSSLYIVNQIALEKTPLQWYDITGGRDITPSGTLPYVVGGSFLEYLSLSYGEEKLSSFIKECCLFPLFATSGSIFRRIYGISITDAWSDFLSSRPVSSSVRDADDITGWGTWSSLFLSALGIYAYDSSSSAVYSIENEEVRKMKTITSSSALSYSPSLILSSYQGSGTRCVSVQGKTWGKTRVFDDYYSGLLMSDEKVLLLTEEDRFCRLDYCDIESGEVLLSFPLGSDITIGKGAALSSLEAVFVVSLKGEYGFLHIDLEKERLEMIEMEEGITLSSLSLSDGGLISFSYAYETDTSSLMKYGEMWKDDGVWYYRLSNDEFNGGVMECLKMEDEVYFVASSFNGRKIKRVKYSSLSFTGKKEAAESQFNISSPSSVESLEGRRYNPLLYMNKGLLLPFAQTGGTLIGSSFGAGVMYTTTDPTERHTLVFSSGWDYDKSSLFLSFGYKWKDYFSSTFFSSLQNGIVKAELDLKGKYRWYLSSSSKYVDISDEVSLAYRNSEGTALNTFSLSYTEAYSAGIGRHENSGWGVKMTVENISPEFELALLIPRLLPFSSTPSMTYSVPVILKAGVKDVVSPVISASLKAYLFTYEIQKSLPFMCTYLKNVDLVFSPKVTLRTENMDARDEYSIYVSLGFSPLIGYLTRLSMNLNAGVVYSRDGGLRFSVSFDNGVF